MNSVNFLKFENRYDYNTPVIRDFQVTTNKFIAINAIHRQKFLREHGAITYGFEALRGVDK